MSMHSLDTHQPDRTIPVLSVNGWPPLGNIDELYPGNLVVIDHDMCFIVSIKSYPGAFVHTVTIIDSRGIFGERYFPLDLRSWCSVIAGESD